MWTHHYSPPRISPFPTRLLKLQMRLVDQHFILWSEQDDHHIWRQIWNWYNAPLARRVLRNEKPAPVKGSPVTHAISFVKSVRVRIESEFS